MDSSAQIVADLRAHFKGELYGDAITRGLYSTDASIFQVLPIAVAVPKDEADLQAVVKYAAEQGLSIVARGAGTGLSGGALGPGIIVDLSIHFREKPIIHDDTVVVQPGLTISEINSTLAVQGRRLSHDIPRSKTRTIGGYLATNGLFRNQVAGLRVIWDNGEIEEINHKSSNGIRCEDIRTAMAEIVPGSDTKKSAGYAIHEYKADDPSNLLKFIVGSEGTLGIITSATLKTEPIPDGIAGTILGFDSIEDAIRASESVCRLSSVVSCELLDRRLIAMGKGISIPLHIEAVLIVKIETDSAENAFESAITLSPSIPGVPNDWQTIQAFRDSSLAGLYSMRSGSRPIPIIEDVMVPVDTILEFLNRVQLQLRTRDLTAAIHIDTKNGIVRVRPIVDLNSVQDREKLWPLADAVYGIVLEMNGTMTSENGIGLSRTPWVRMQSVEQAELFREVKRIFDPKSIFNPGKIVGPDPTRPAWPLRPIISEKTSLEVFDRAELKSCSSCGDCRPRTGSERMCPIFTATGSEKSTPRAKANLVRLVNEIDLDANSEQIKTVAKQCVNCKMCRDECTAQVDIPQLMNHLKSNLWREYGTDRSNWFLARVESLIGIASTMTFTANALLGTKWGRWLLSRLFGLDRTLRLPAFRYRTFTFRAWTKGWTRRTKKSKAQHNSSLDSKRFALFVDPLSNATDPLSGDSAVAVLKHHGAEVVVVSRSRPTGLAALTAGDVETARNQARKTLGLLLEYVHEGYRIVCLDPNAVIAITQEYPVLWNQDNPDVKLVAENTIELMALLWQWHESGQLKTDFREQDLWLGHHVPCHIKALKTSPTGPKLLSLIPGIRLQTIDAGCSGMAGPWGTLANHRSQSTASGSKMIAELNQSHAIFGSSECGSCRIQMQEATGKRSVHPVQYLAMAYGLMPEVGRRLITPLKDRVSR